MIAKQTVFLNAARNKALPEGDSGARFLLVRRGHDIEQSSLSKYPGALELVNSEVATAKAPQSPPAKK